MKNELDLYLCKIKSCELDDDLCFSAIIQKSEDLLSFTNDDLSTSFGISVTTVSRWKSGATVPHPRMRRYVLDFLEEKVRFRLYFPEGEWPEG